MGKTVCLEWDDDSQKLVECEDSSAVFEVEWTGSYPTLCIGEWIIKKNGVKVDIPEDVREYNMNTFIEYSEWYFDEECYDRWEDCVDGLGCNDWIKENNYWIKKFCSNHAEKVKLYEEINKKDWRRGSCGGCI